MTVTDDRRPRLACGLFGDGWLGRIAGSAEPWILDRLGLASTPVEQVHLTWGPDASREIVVSWRTPQPVRAPFVAVGGIRLPARSFRTPGRAGWWHRATIAPLDPGTDVTYAVGHDGRLRSRTARFRTGPVGSAPFVFTAYGDHGTPRPAPDTPPTHEARRTVDLVEALDPAFHLVAGDLSYANGDPRV